MSDPTTDTLFKKLEALHEHVRGGGASQSSFCAGWDARGELGATDAEQAIHEWYHAAGREAREAAEEKLRVIARRMVK